MKKIFKFMILALVAMCGFASCSEDCDHKFIEVNYANELVGTWTCLEANYAEAMTIKADGTVLSTGLEDGEYWQDINGTWKVENNKLTMTFEDDDNFDGSFDLIPGQTLSIVDSKTGERTTYNYCANELSEEIVGMWVCTDGPTDADNDMMIRNFSNDGKTTFTGLLPIGDDPESILNYEVNYKVVGNLVFLELPENNAVKYNAERLIYSPNATALGDILTIHRYLPTENGLIESKASFLRVNEGLSFTAKPYAYNTAYISNVKGGKDEDFSILGHPFNMANVKAGDFDMLFHSELFCVDLKENHIKQLYRANGQDIEINIPITVEGNKVTLDMSAENPAFRKVDMYMFQDADACQLHMYMHTKDFINYFANMEIYNLLAEGKIALTDTDAIEEVYAKMEARVESINVSFVFKAIK